MAGAAAGAGSGAIAGGVHSSGIGAGVDAVAGVAASTLTNRNPWLEEGQQLGLELGATFSDARSLSLAAIRDRALIHFPGDVRPLFDYDHAAVCREPKRMSAF
jgi:hypothetical protein